MVWVGKMQSSKLTQESEMMLRKAFLRLFFLWGIQTPGEDEKMWLLTWWFGLHGTFPGNRCCSLCTGTTVTGKLTQEVQSLKRNKKRLNTVYCAPSESLGSHLLQSAALEIAIVFFLLLRRVCSPHRRAVLDKSTEGWRQKELSTLISKP